MAVAEISVAEQTHRRIVELERAGLSRRQAFDYVEGNDGLGIKRPALEQRFYSTAARLRERDGAAPSPRGRRPKPRVEPDGDGALTIAEQLEMVVALLAGIVEQVSDLEEDAEKWRDVRAVFAR